MAEIVLSLQDVHKSYHQGKAEPLRVLNGINLTIHRGEIAALVGQSGTGKSTLLQIAGLLDAPNSGVIQLNGTDASRARDRKRTALRRDHLGFVYQFHHLLPEFTAQENVAMPHRIQGMSRHSAAMKAAELLTALGLEERLHHAPSELSGGEQQRVAIARALVHQPSLLLADEPTGNLDPTTADHVFEKFLNVARESGTAILLVTHNPDLAQKADKQYTLKNGLLT